MGIFFGFQICLCAGSRKVFLQQKRKSSHSRCKKVQKTLLHNKKLRKASSVAKAGKSFLLQQRWSKVTHTEKSAENFTAQWKVKKSQLCGRNWRNVPSMVEKKNKPTLQCLPSDFGLNICAQTRSGRMVPQSPFRGAPGLTSFLEKAQTKRCLITLRRMSKV